MESILAKASSWAGRITAVLFLLRAVAPVSGAETAAAALPAEASAAEAVAIKGRLHPSYQVFAAQLKLPEIRGGQRGEVVVLGEEAVSIRPGVELSPAELGEVSRAVRVPGKVLLSIQKSLDPQKEGTALAAQFKLAVTDYLYLLERWTTYQPREPDKPVKVAGLESLKSGRILEAWEQYARLRKPRPPGGTPGAD